MSDNTQRFITDAPFTPTSVGSEDGADYSVYESEDGDDSADSVDPKRLFRKPSVNDIRWFYRNGPLASTIVNKPVDDAFKHGYTAEAGQASDTQAFLEEIEDSYREANRKARRDGFAIMWFRLRDTANEWEPPENVRDIHEVKVLTVDDLTDTKPIAFEEKLTAGNVQNIMSTSGQAVSTTSEVTALSDLIQRAEQSQLDVQGDVDDPDDPKRLSRHSADSAVLDSDLHSYIDTHADDRSSRVGTDAVIEDPSIERGDMDGRLIYGRSRLYDITDNGIVISNRLDDENYEDPVGYLYDRGTGFQPLMIHPSRVYHVTWRDDVDGNVNDTDVWGGWEGDSVLMPVIHLLRSLMKGDWALMQKVFRQASPLHVVNYEEGVSDENVNKAERQMQNVNTKSVITSPPGFDVEAIEKVQQREVEPAFDVMFNQICAATEMTRSVLFGTQAGTVSGSEVDIKNYFNKIERLRRNRYESEMRDLVNWYSQFGARDYELDGGLNLEWGPLFKLSALDRAEAMSRHVQLVTQAQSNFVMSDEEARSLLEEQWADWSDVELDGILDDDTMERLFNIAAAQDGELTDIGGNPRVGQNGGGMEQGQQTASSQPNNQ